MIKYPGLVGEPGGGPGVAWTKTPPRVDRFESFLVAADEAQCDSEIEMTESEVLVQLDSVARVLYGGPDIARPKAGLGKHILDLRVFPIERCSPKSGFPSLSDKWSEVLDGAIVPLHNQGTREPKVSVRQVRIERKCSFEQTVGCLAIAAGALVHMPEPALAIIPRAHVLRPLRDYALAFGARQRRLDSGGDARSDVVLHRKDIGQVAVVSLSPEMGAGGNIDKLAADAHPLPGPAHATFEDITDAKVTANLPEIDGFSFVSECGIAGDDEKPAPFRQRRDDVLGNAVDKIFLLGIATDIVKREDGDRRPVGQRPRRCRIREDRRPFGPPGKKSAIDPHRPGDVLDLLLAHVLERNGELVAHLIAYHPADADAARFSQGLKARCDVDTVAEDVVVVDDDVAEIDPDAEIDAPFGLHAGIACGHLALHLDRATNRIDHAHKLAKQTVARCVDDAAAVLPDLGVGNLSPQRLQRSERAFFVRPHEARVARDVGRQDRCEAPLDPFLRHGRRPYK